MDNDLETVEIPDILLATQGLRTASREVDATVIAEAHRLIEASKMVEAGLGTLFSNFLSKLTGSKVYKPEEVEALLNRIKNMRNPAVSNTNPNSPTAMPDLEEYKNQMTGFLNNLNGRTTAPFSFGKPFQKGMQLQWNQLETLAKNAEEANLSGNVDDASGAYNALQQALGNAGIGLDSALGKYWTSRAMKWLTSDDKLLNQIIPGVYVKTGTGTALAPVTYKQFFEGSSKMLHHGINDIDTAVGDMVITDKNAVKASLDKLAVSAAASAKVKGFAQSLGTTGVLATMIPSALGAGAAMLGAGTMIKNGPPQSDFDNAAKVTGSGGYMHVDPSTAPSNGLGGTTNGNNIGNLGGQYNPQNNPNWVPAKPNLPQNPNDWLPTGTTDYYNMVNRKSSVREAQAVANVENIEDVVRNVLTMFDQGAPGEATFNNVISYLKNVDAQAQTYIAEHEQSQQAKKVETTPKVNG